MCPQKGQLRHHGNLKRKGLYSAESKESCVRLRDGTVGMWNLEDKELGGVVLQTLAAAGAIGLLIVVLVLWWYIVWHTNLKYLPIAQELMGKRRKTQAQKDKIAEDIREIKRVHRKRGPTLEAARQASLSRRVRTSVLSSHH